jgi:integrase
LIGVRQGKPNGKEGHKMGMIYKRKRKDKVTGEIKEGETLWIKYYRYGKPYRESTGSDKIKRAKDLLKQREGEISQGKLPGIHFEKVTFDELAEDFLTDYRINGKDTVNKAERSVKYLKEAFGGLRVPDITTDKTKAYVENRMEAGLSNASINRELAALKRIFHLAAKCTPPRVALIPYIPMLKESNVRKGFFEHGEYVALKDALPSELKPVVTFAYHSGWRKTEILELTWDRVDLKEGVVRIDPGEAKNEEGRELYLSGELLTEIQTLHGNRRLDCPFVFHRDGIPIKDFRWTWDAACINAGLCEPLRDENGEIVRDEEGIAMKVPTKLFHDFRRTAVRDMIRSGIPERVAMKITGHKTRSVFDRYNIVSNQDLKEAALKKQASTESMKVAADKVEQKKGKLIPFKEAQNE